MTIANFHLTDGDKGDITVGSSGTTLTIDNGVVSYAKMQNISDTGKVLGRSTAGAGSPEEIPCGAGGRDLLANSVVWTAYVPTWTASGTAPALGTDGVITGRYCQIGKTVVVNFYLKLGTAGNGMTTGTGYYKFSLPIQAQTGTTLWAHGGAHVLDAGTAIFIGTSQVTKSGNEALVYTTNTVDAIGQLIPFTFADSDVVRFSLTYEGV